MERLQKVIAASGYTSRRKAEDLIVQGRVAVNGEIVCKLGTKVKKVILLQLMENQLLVKIKYIMFSINLRGVYVL